MSEPTLSPVFGPEIGTYMRLWYGTRADRFAGVTPGRFYDFRAFPVPYSPYTETAFQFQSDAYDGAVLKLSIVRENVTPDNVSDISYAVVTAPNTVFGLRLSKGLNTITASIDDVVLTTTQVTALRLSTYLYSVANQIYNGFWAKLNNIENDLLSSEPTLLASPVIGFSDLFPTAANWNRMSRGLVMNALMNNPGSTQSVQALTQSMLYQTPVLSRTRTGLGLAWLQGLQTQPQSVNGSTMHIWAPSAWEGRYASSIAIARRDQLIVGRDFVADSGTGDFTVLNKPSALEFEDRRSWLSMTSWTDVADLEFTAHSLTHGQVQRPGLLDEPRDIFDTGMPLDHGRVFDANQSFGDPSPNFYVGIAITPTPLFAQPSLPMSTLDKVLDSYTIGLELHGVATYVDVLEWVINTQALANASGWAGSSYGTATVTETPTEPTAPGVLVGLRDFGAGHAHPGEILTAAQRATIKSGGTVTVTSQNSDGTLGHHTHQLQVSWDNGYVVKVTGNHNHLATAADFAEVGV